MVYSSVLLVCPAKSVASSLILFSHPAPVVRIADPVGFDLNSVVLSSFTFMVNVSSGFVISVFTGFQFSIAVMLSGSDVFLFISISRLRLV